MKETKLFIVAIFMISSFFLTAQVSVNTDGSDPDGSAMLDVKSSDKGFLPPCVTNVSAVSNPVAGLMVYDQNANCIRYYDGTTWSECMGQSLDCGLPFTDGRNGKVHNSVQIGTQCWMAENLNIGTMINVSSSQTNNDTIEKYCYNNSTTKCNTYGGLYQWNEIMQYVTTKGTQGICPSGWHLPTDAEWKILEGAVDSQSPVDRSVWNKEGWRGTDVGKNLKSTSGWHRLRNGTDLYGFGALPGGYRGSAGDTGDNITEYGSWWSSSRSSGTNAWGRTLYYENDRSGRRSWDKTVGLSVRCLKDNGL